jgi:hypothetical protein
VSRYRSEPIARGLGLYTCMESMQCVLASPKDASCSRAKLHSLGRMRQDGRVSLPLLFTYVQAYHADGRQTAFWTCGAQRNQGAVQYTRLCCGFVQLISSHTFYQRVLRRHMRRLMTSVFQISSPPRLTSDIYQAPIPNIKSHVQSKQDSTSSSKGDQSRGRKSI